MSRKVIVMMEVADEVTNEDLHEALCLACYEGVGIGNTEGDGYDIKDVQVVGSLEQTLAQEDATEEQIEAVDGVISRIGKPTLVQD